MVKMGTVWDRTAEFLTDNLPNILPIALLAYFVPLSILGSLEPVMANAGSGLALALGVIMLAFGVLATWGRLTLIAMSLDTEGDPGSVALRRLLPVLIVALLTLLPIVLLALPPALTVVVTERGLSDLAEALPPPVYWALCIYCVLAIVAAVWLMARLILVYPLVVAERSIIGAITNSWRLTRGIALAIIGVTILYMLVLVVAVLAAKFVFGSVFTLISGGGDGLSLSNILTSVTVAAVQTGFFAVVPIFTAKLYQAVISAARA